MSNRMINPNFMKYIPDDKKQLCYESMIADIYYFYNGIKPTPEEHIVVLDGNYYNLSKGNLLLATINSDVKPGT